MSYLSFFIDFNLLLQGLLFGSIPTETHYVLAIYYSTENWPDDITNVYFCRCWYVVLRVVDIGI